MKISYNWLKWYIEGDLPSPEKLEDIFTFKLCEVESLDKLGTGGDEDWILDLNILPNRAHDLLSHQGVARELAGMISMKFKDPTPLYKVPSSQPTKLEIAIETPLCRRYMGRIVRNVKIGSSPDWVVKRLESIGQRSINNIVDATNLVMFDCGQPCHVFDAKKLANEKIIVRMAHDAELITTLTGDNVALQDKDAVIADEKNALAIAGVKGGTVAEVDENTTDIVIEVANFDPVSVRKTARRLNLLTDSAKRFENDLSPELADFAMRQISGLIIDMCPEAVFEEIIDIYPNPQESRTIKFSPSWINGQLGTTLSADDIVKILTDYGYEITGAGDARVLAVPSLRLDLTGQHDIAEEVLRLYGLENIKEMPLSLGVKPAVNETMYQMMAARKKLVTEGYRETMTYSFRKKGEFEVVRGVGDKGALRKNLVDGLKESFEMNKLNAPLLGITDLKLFEIGAVFPKSGEEIHIAIADKKGVTEMPLAEWCVQNNITIKNSYDDVLPESSNTETHFELWSSYPFIVRDIALWVPESVTADEIINLINQYKGTLVVRGPELFDTFNREGLTSYAFRLVFQSFERTLEDGDISPIIQKITEVLQKKGWQVR